jgi:16S rRNA (guanine527-N7)-methyltransferase
MKDRYIDELVAWNKEFNLTGLKTKEDISKKLYDDSLNISKHFDLDRDIWMIDIGCGAGFPGIPLKIEHPKITLHLVDSIQKKIDFVSYIIKNLDLKNTKAICTRAEVLGHNPSFRQRYDVAVSRAVAQLNVLCEYCLPFVKLGGLFIVPKGPDIEAEINAARSAISQLGGKLKDQIKVDSGYLVVIEKIKSTPNSFPRETGIPSKRPL